MKFGSVCSGVEAASLAWEPLGWECKFVSEIEPFPCAVLQHRFGASAPINQLDPNEIIITDEEWALIDELKKVNKDWMKACDNADLISRFKERKQREAWIKDNALLNKEGKIPNEGDFTKIGKKYAGQIDLLVGGTPCQDLSIAGKRAGFDGERSSLAIDFVRLAYESQCKWFVWENVPGVFSSNEGRDFATLLSLFTGSKVEVPQDGWGTAGFVCNARRDRYGVAWRTLDGQFTRTQRFPFAVPQRRRRVFLVGYFGDWTRAAKVLLEPGRSKWDTPSRFKAREILAEIARADPALADRALRGTGEGSTERPIICTDDQGGSVMSVETDGNAGTLNNEQIVCGDFVQTLKIRSGCEGGGKDPLVQDELSATLGCGNDQTLFVVHGAQTPINNEEEYANPLGCCNDGLENVISMHNKQFGQCEENLASTLLSTDYKEPQIVCYDNQTRARNPMPTGDVSCTMQAAMGEGGNNVPLVQCFDARGNGDGSVSPTATGDHLNCITDFTPVVHECYAVDKRNQTLDAEISNTLNTCTGGDNYGTIMQECYAIDSMGSNAMKSSNPYSGFHKEEIAKTLDTTDPNPTKNQGGNVIVDAVAVAENIIGRADNTGGNGVGAQEELAYTQNATGVMGVCTKGNGDRKDFIYGNAEEKRAYEVLFALWQRVGKSAFCQWASGRLGSIQETEILQQNLHGKSIRCETCEGKSILDDSSLSCKETDPERFLFFLWERFQLGHSSHRPELAEQFIGQLALCLSELSHKNSSRIASTVRRLLPIETERLMGFPDNHTRIPWKGLPAEQCPDSPRYKACGNSFCVNVVQWIGEQIDKVEQRK